MDGRAKDRRRAAWPRLRPGRAAARSAVLLLAVAALLAAPEAAAQGGGDSPLAVGAAAPPAPGDSVRVTVWNEPTISGTYGITESGRVLLPRLGAVHVTALPIRVVQDSLQAALASFLRNPAVEVRVLRRISLHGEVRQPDIYLVDVTMTLREVIAAAGGLTPEGDARKLVLVRGGERIRLGVRNHLATEVVELRSGDQIVVGRKHWLASANPLSLLSTGIGLVTLIISIAR